MNHCDGIPHLSQRLNDLFDSTHRPGSAEPYTNKEVADALSGRGHAVSGVYLSQLRNGRKNNPSARLIGGLATFFNVPVAYFYGEPRARVAPLSPQPTRADNFTTLLAGISDDGLDLLDAFIDYLRRIEGLDDRPIARGDASSN